jgi:hypothetical protein
MCVNSVKSFVVKILECKGNEKNGKCRVGEEREVGETKKSCFIGSLRVSMSLRPYSQQFIFFVTCKWAH